MNVLLAKDLRLSLDAVRPWVLIVIGFGLVSLVISTMPTKARPAPAQIARLGGRRSSTHCINGTMGT